MRGWVIISVLALAGCGEHLAWNPKYQFGDGDYGDYKVKREIALLTGAESPETIPVALPAQAPTAEEIAGSDPVPIPPTARIRVAKAAVVTTATGAVQDLPVTKSGPYAGTTPVLVRYAFEASHQPGVSVYPRSGGSVATAARVCASFPDVNAAQTAFLASGGPARDPQGFDPDGDGFVCGWDPAPFRKSEL